MYASLDASISPAVPVALCTLADAKALLGITGSDKDAELNARIGAATAAIERYCGTIFGKRTVTETFRFPDRVSQIVLKYAPVVSVASVAIDGVAEDLANLDVAKALGIIRHGDFMAFGTAKTVVVYSAGYESADIPPAVARAALDLVAYEYRSQNQTDDIARESVVDVGTAEYRSAAERTLTRNGVAVPARIALALSLYVVGFAL